MSNDIKKTEAAPSAIGLPLEPRTAEEASRLAIMMAQSNLVPEAYRGKPENVFVAMMMGRDLGLSTMQAMRGIYVVHGTPAASAMLLVGLVRRSGECMVWRMVESTDTHATIETQRRGDREPTRYTYTVEDAKQAGLLPAKGDSNWAKRPRTMLRHRAESELARTVYPDVIQGLYTEDEAAELAPREMGELARVENVRPLSALPETSDPPEAQAETAQTTAVGDVSSRPDSPPEAAMLPAWAVMALEEWATKKEEEKMPKGIYDRLVAEIQKLPRGGVRGELGKRLLALGHAPETVTQREPGQEG